MAMNGGDYKMYSEKESQPSLCYKMCSWLYSYTIGSCRYFGKGNITPSYSHRDRLELRTMGEIPLKKNAAEDQWKLKAQKADSMMKKRIRYHFQNHISKWTDLARPRFPWKLILHVLLVVLVTVQISVYAVEVFKVTNFLIENNDVFKELFIRQHHGRPRDKLFTIQQVYAQIDHVADAYFNITKQAVGPFYYIEDNNATLRVNKLKMLIEFTEFKDCDHEVIEHFINFIMMPAFILNTTHFSRDVYRQTNNETLDDGTACGDVDVNCCSVNQCDYTTIQQINSFVNEINSLAIQQIRFEFVLGGYYQTGVVDTYNAVTATFGISVILYHELHSSHMNIEIELTPTLERICKRHARIIGVLDGFVLLVLSMSSATYILSLFKTRNLARDIKIHFLAYHGKELRWTHIYALFNKWYLLQLFACLLLLIATILKIISDNADEISISMKEVVSILLGIGDFLLWCGLFGLLNYFESLNVLLITLSLALPSFLRFAVCMLILFLAFMFCGWLVIGPYNDRFRNPLKATESLIGLLNGDEIMETFSSFEEGTVSPAISIFSKLYLVLFVFIFIYIVLSLFIGIFDHAYDSLSAHWKERSHGFLLDWTDERPDNDLTKNYPFPVPRIRNLPNDDTSSSQSSSEDSVNVDDSPVLVRQSECNSTSNEELIKKTENKSLSHFSSVPSLIKPVTVVEPSRRHNTYHSQLCSPNRYRASHLRTHNKQQRRHRSAVKSVAVEPSDANEQDVAKARFKLQSKGTLLVQTSTLEESDV